MTLFEEPPAPPGSPSGLPWVLALAGAGGLQFAAGGIAADGHSESSDQGEEKKKKTVSRACLKGTSRCETCTEIDTQAKVPACQTPQESETY